MALWKIGESGPEKLVEAKFKEEKVLEENIEEWICHDHSLLGEPLLIIGRQVLIPEIRDKIDLLAVDPQGVAVIIELKRGTLKDPVDIQAIRYASYISKWEFEDFEDVARNFYGRIGDSEFNFNALFEDFCEEAGIDEIPSLNTDQRIIILGASIREKLGSVALWLRDHNVDIKVIEIQAYKEGQQLYVEPSVIVPIEASKFIETGRRRRKDEPWTKDGMSWHLNKRCSPKTKDLLLALNELIEENLDTEGPRWNQKHYVAYAINNRNWLTVVTMVELLRLDFLVKSGTFTSDQIAVRLGIVKFDKDESYSEKYHLPSSVLIKNRSEKTDKIHIRIKDDFNIESSEFLEFLLEAYNNRA